MQSGLRHKQRGATFLGILTIGSILMLAVYAGIRLVPLYLDNMAVVRAMTAISKSMQGSAVTPATVRTALYARWTVDYISSVKPEDIEIVSVPQGLEMRANYEGRAPFIGNISLVVEFDKSVVISSSGGL